MIFTAPGINGYGAQLHGQGNSEFRVVAVLHDTAANVEIWLRLIEQLQFTIISLVDDYGVTMTGMMVTKVGEPNKRAAVSSLGDCRGEIVLEGVKAY